MNTNQTKGSHRVTDLEARAILLAYDELLSYWETVGYEGSLDDEEMPHQRIPEALNTLRAMLTRWGIL